jgi:LysM repeat protein
MVVARIAARLFALVALAAVAIGVYLIVHSGLSTHASTVRSTTQLLSGPHAHPRHRRTPRIYVVKGGDTLSGISIRTHVSIFRLTQINPSLSPNSLQTGQRLKLRR